MSIRRPCWRTAKRQTAREPRRPVSRRAKPDPDQSRHGSITVDATQRRFIQLLDGTRTRDQLAAEMGMAREDIDQLVQFSMNAALLED